jgi:hypothetical protein
MNNIPDLTLLAIAALEAIRKGEKDAAENGIDKTKTSQTPVT